MKKVFLLLFLPTLSFATVKQRFNHCTGCGDFYTVLDTNTFVNSSSITANNFSPNQGVCTDASSNLITSGSCGGGGGGSSALEVFSGPTRSSPTASIALNSSDFNALIKGSTFYFSLNPATTDFYSLTNSITSNAMLNLNDSNNPFSSGNGYGAKIILLGHLGSPTAGYGVSSLVGNGVSANEYAYYGSASGASAAINYGAFLGAAGGAQNFALWVDSGQVYLASVSTLTVGGSSAFLSSMTGTVFNFTGPAQSTVTYGLTMGSGTVNGAGDGQIVLTIGVSTYVVTSATTPVPTVGHLAVWTSTNGTLGDGGTSGGSGTPGGTNTQMQYNNASSFGGTSVLTVGASSVTAAGVIQFSSSVALGTSVGTNGQVFTSAGPGATPSWQNAGSGNPAGNPYDVQIDSNGAFGGDDNFQDNGSTISMSNVSTATISNYGTLTYSGYTLFAFAGTTITLDNASPLITASSVTVNNALVISSNTIMPGATFYQNGNSSIGYVGSTHTILAITDLNGTVNISTGLQLTGQTGNIGQGLASGGPNATPTWSSFLTGNQTITLSGDVSGSGATAITTILANTVPNAHNWTGTATHGSSVTVNSNIYISSNAVMPGATFYQNGQIIVSTSVGLGINPVALFQTNNTNSPGQYTNAAGATQYANVLFGSSVTAANSSVLNMQAADTTLQLSAANSAAINNMMSTIVSSGPFPVNAIRGLNFAVQQNGSGAVTTMVGALGGVTDNSTATVTTAIGMKGTTSLSGGGGTITAGVGVQGGVISNGTAGNLISTAKAIEALAPTNSAGTITNDYGVYINAQQAGTMTNNAYGLYQAGGSDLNYLAGNLAISSNVITSGTTFYENGPVISTANWVITTSTDNTNPNPPASLVIGALDGTQPSMSMIGFGNAPSFTLARGDGAGNNPSALQANDQIGNFAWYGHNGSAFSTNRAGIKGFAAETWTATANGTYFTFNTTKQGAATAGGTERMRLDDQGHLGINTTAPSANMDVYGQVSDTYTIRISTAVAGFALAVTTNSHIVSNGPTPTISACGATPNGSVVGDDYQGTITIGGGSVTGCVLTFSQTYGTGCTVNCTTSDSITTSTPDVATTPTTMTLGFSASIGGGKVLYHCSGYGTACR